MLVSYIRSFFSSQQELYIFFVTMSANRQVEYIYQ
jgi:hypothetical protein